MSTFCLATVVYPGAEKYFADFFAALSHIPQMADCALSIANQGGVDLSRHLPTVACQRIETLDLDNDLSIAAVRSALFNHLKNNTKSDIYIFTDIDDRPTPEAFTHHQAALRTADFSYGNMKLYKENFDHSLEKRLFDISDVPQDITSITPLLRAHFTGLSALAMTRATLKTVPKIWPDHVTYLDWWLVCSLVIAGKTGAAADTVIDYRLYDRGLHALQRSDDLENLEKRLAEVINTLQALPDHTMISTTLDKLRNLQAGLQTGAEPALLSAISQMSAWILWFEDIFILADHYGVTE